MGWQKCSGIRRSYLEGCSDVTALSVTTTFSGNEVASNLLEITGSAAGAGVVIATEAGPLTLGQPAPAQLLTMGENTLNFTAYLKGTGAAITPGEFQSIADFTLSYQ